ncbi:MAG TPA: M20/M25/M40 family metallo-hydrolase [Thermoanaerobaculia bacterium]|nr:M20/M25/M40 family metallo-hydrolase [Thermoanaerobaculia bacterium]
MAISLASEAARELDACIEEMRPVWIGRLRDYVAVPSAFRFPEDVAERTRLCLEGGLRPEHVPHHATLARRIGDDLAALGLRVTAGTGTLPGDEAGVPYVRARTDGDGPVDLLFSSHYDVVGADPGTWRTDPFAALESGGWIFGRGTSDAKGPLSAMVSACEALSRVGLRPAGAVELIFTGDEEVGGRRGIRSAALRDTLAARACVVGEPSALRGKRTVGIMTKGRLEVFLSARQGGTASAHSALGGEDSPLERTVSALEHLRRCRPRLTEAFRIRMEKETAWQGVTRSEPQVRILGLQQSSVAASGNITGGMAEARVEVRFHPPMSGDLVEEWLRSALAEQGDAGLEVAITRWNEPAVLPPANGLHEEVVRRAERMGLGLSVAAFPAGSDMSPLVNLHGIPTCIASCADLAANAIHGDDERISERELIDSVKLYAALMVERT